MIDPLNSAPAHPSRRAIRHDESRAVCDAAARSLCHLTTQSIDPQRKCANQAQCACTISPPRATLVALVLQPPETTLICRHFGRRKRLQRAKCSLSGARRPAPTGSLHRASTLPTHVQWSDCAHSDPDAIGTLPRWTVADRSHVLLAGFADRRSLPSVESGTKMVQAWDDGSP